MIPCFWRLSLARWSAFERLHQWSICESICKGRNEGVRWDRPAQRAGDWYRCPYTPTSALISFEHPLISFWRFNSNSGVERTMLTISLRLSLGAFHRHRQWARVSLNPSLQRRARCRAGLVLYWDCYIFSINNTGMLQQYNKYRRWLCRFSQCPFPVQGPSNTFRDDELDGTHTSRL